MNCNYFLDLVNQRLGPAMLPEVRADLLQLAAYDVGRMERNPWFWVLPAVQNLLQPQDTKAVTNLAPFMAAWGFLYAATIRLDQIQDHDPVDDPLPTNQTAAQYNLLLAYSVLASSILDQLSAEVFPARRLLRLRRFWSDMLLRMASGQQRDLTAAHPVLAPDTLDYYEELARAKTGAAFALAFGGVATLLSDDSALIERLTLVGEIFGLLVQYGDDLSDAADQPNRTVTFTSAFQYFAQTWPRNQAEPTPATFWSTIYQVYCAYVQQLLTDYPTSLQHGVAALFAQAFVSLSVEEQLA
jgi:hypothetical protein